MERTKVHDDHAQYDDLASTWWQPHGPLAMLQWIAVKRAELVPMATRVGAVLVDLGCGAGLLAPNLVGKGYVHIGVDLNEQALAIAADHGVTVLRGDVLSIPLPDQIADVVCAGEILEHVADHIQAVNEACRLLRPGGTLVIDTIAATRLARFVAVTVAERIPGGAPRGIHDPKLFVDRRELIECCAQQGVTLRLIGLRPKIGQMLRWLWGARNSVEMTNSRLTAVLFQASGIREFQPR